MSWQLLLPDESATQQLGQWLAQQIPSGCVHLTGDLGAGKTTLTRYWLQAAGVQGTIKSPTYTLVEPYQIVTAGQQRNIYHFDLYRINDPDELDQLGIRDYLQMPDSLLLIEWPDKGGHLTPAADWQITLTNLDNGLAQRRVEIVTRHKHLDQAVLARLGHLLVTG